MKTERPFDPKAKVFNPKEQLIVGLMLSNPGTIRLSEVAPAIFPGKRYEWVYSQVMNSVRKARKAGIVRSYGKRGERGYRADLAKVGVES